MLKFKKNLFNLAWKSSFSVEKKKLLLKKNFTLWSKFFFFLNFTILKNDFINFFFLKKIINFLNINFLNINLYFYIFFSKKLTFSLIKLDYFTTFYNYFFIEMWLINDLNKYSITYLLTNIVCLKIFKNFILKFLIFINSKFLKMKIGFFYFKNFEFIKNFEFFQFLYEKIEFIVINPDFFIKNLTFYSNSNKKLKNFFIKNFNNFLSFNKFYFAYQVFLNNTMYLNRLILFQTNVSPISFNVLFLKNFNRIFFWTGDSYKEDFFFREFFLWGVPIVSLNKGYPFYNFNLIKEKNTLFLNFDYLNMSSQKQLNFYFLNKNLIYKSLGFYLKNNINIYLFLNTLFF